MFGPVQFPLETPPQLLKFEQLKTEQFNPLYPLKQLQVFGAVQIPFPLQFANAEQVTKSHALPVYPLLHEQIFAPVQFPFELQFF